MSEISLRNSEKPLEESESAVSSAVAPGATTPEKGQKDRGKEAGAKSSWKKNSLVSLGLSSGDYTTQFDEEENEGLEDCDDDGQAPGGFRRPSSAYKLARYDHSGQKIDSCK